MKQLICIPLLMFFAAAYGQVKKEKNSVLIYPQAKTFFLQNLHVKEIRFQTSLQEEIYVNVVEKGDADESGSNRFSFGFIGDLYLFEKKFGAFNFPFSYIRNQLDFKADRSSVTGYIRQDTVFFKIINEYASRNPSADKIWLKVEDTIALLQPLTVLEQQLAAAVRNVSPREKLFDSVFLFKLLLEKTGVISEVTTITGEGAAYAAAFMPVLKASGPWDPFETGGRGVRTRVLFYIRLNSDGSVTAAYKH
jgi:hypothetical protein